MLNDGRSQLNLPVLINYDDGARMRRAVALVNLLHGGRFREEYLPDAIVRLLQVLQKLLVHLDHLDKVTHQLRILVLRETVRRGKVLITFDTKLIIFSETYI